MRRSREDFLEIQEGAVRPAARRQDVAVVLRQQMSQSVAWKLAYYFLTGRTQEWVDEYVMTPQMRALIAGNGEGATWVARLTMAPFAAEAAYQVDRYVFNRMAAKFFSKMLARTLARYGVSVSIAAGFTASGVGTAVGLAADAVLTYLLVDDIISMRDQLIEGLLDVWFGESV